MNKITFPLIAILLTTGIAGIVTSCTEAKGEQSKVIKKTDAIPVSIYNVSASSNATIVAASGRVTTDNETLMSFKVGGVIEKIHVNEGDRVRKGQVLASIDMREITAGVTQATLAFEKSGRDYTRLQNLFKDSVITLEQLQNAKTGLDIAKEQLDAAKFNQQYASIIAPADGSVLKKFVNPGQITGPGEPILLVNETGDNQWILKVNASDKQWSLVNINDSASVSIDAFPGETFHGVVKRKAEKADSNTGTFGIDIQLTTPTKKLASGIFGSAKIKTQHLQKTWSIPYEALLDADGNEAFVFVTDDMKTANKRSVTIGTLDTDVVQISGGLNENESIIISGSAYLNEGSAINVR